MARLYTSGAVQELADKYIDLGGEVFEIGREKFRM